MPREFIRSGKNEIPRSTAHDWQDEEIYPKYIKFGPRASGLFADEHDRIMALRAGGGSKEELQALVRLIHQERQEAADAVRESLKNRAA